MASATAALSAREASGPRAAALGQALASARDLAVEAKCAAQVCGVCPYHMDLIPNILSHKGVALGMHPSPVTESTPSTPQTVVGALGAVRARLVENGREREGLGAGAASVHEALREADAQCKKVQISQLIPWDSLHPLT